MTSSRNIAGAAGFREPPRKKRERARAIPPQSKISSGNSALERARTRVGVKYTFLEPRQSTIGKHGPISCELVPCAASMKMSRKCQENMEKTSRASKNRNEMKLGPGPQTPGLNWASVVADRRMPAYGQRTGMD